MRRPGIAWVAGSDKLLSFSASAPLRLCPFALCFPTHFFFVPGTRRHSRRAIDMARVVPDRITGHAERRGVRSCGSFHVDERASGCGFDLHRPHPDSCGHAPSPSSAPLPGLPASRWHSPALPIPARLRAEREKKSTHVAIFGPLIFLLPPPAACDFRLV